MKCLNCDIFSYFHSWWHRDSNARSNRDFWKILQGIVDGSASKPALVQDTGYTVEKTYNDIAPYLGAFGVYLMPQ